MYYFSEKIIYERAVNEANYIIKNGATVRETARVFGVNKSTVHKDVAYRLYEYNLGLALKVAKVLEKNKAERHIRGGAATRKKLEQISRKEEP